MKILAIRIRNLASLEGSTEIDFTREPLYSAGIFAITGPTGAGKSTLLDALCLALYAKTPRYAQAREIGVELTDVQGSTIQQSDVRAILRDGMAEGYAEVDFVGIDGQHYRANWQVRRARNRADGSLQQANTTLRNLSSGNDIGGRKTELLAEIVRLVGLNYDQFIRSVLLAQGDFTAFLKADKDQKASLLEKLTGTHIFSELSKKVFERHREEDQQLKLLQHSRAGITILTPEEWEDLSGREKALADTIRHLEAQIESITQEIKWHDDLKGHTTQVTDAYRTLQEHLAEKEMSAERGAYLALVAQVQPTRTWVDAQQEAAELLVEKRKALEEAGVQRQLLDQQLSDAEAAVVEATRHWEAQVAAQEDAKPLLDQAKKLDAQLQAREAEMTVAQQQLDERKAKWAAAHRRLARQREEAETLVQQLDRLQEWKEKRRNRRSVAENHSLIVSKLGDARKQLGEMERASGSIARLETEIKAKTAEHAQLVQRAERLSKEAAGANAELVTIQEQLRAIPIDQLRVESKTLQAAADEMRHADGVWRQLYQALLAERDLTEKVENAQGELANQEAQLAAEEVALQAATEQRKASTVLLEKAMLAASENVETLRANLTDGQPCPVCGSETHPYAHENPPLNHVLDVLKKSHEMVEANYREQFAVYSRLTQSLALLRQAIAAMESDRLRAREAVRLHADAWEALPISRSCADIEAAEKERWIAGQLGEGVERQEAVAEALEQSQVLESTREVLRQTCQGLQTEHMQTANAVKDSEHTLRTLGERLALAQTEHEASIAMLEETRVFLQPHFPDEQWMANWKSHPDAFLDSINAFADEWKQAVEALERGSNRLDVLQATLAGTQSEQQSLGEDVAQAERDLAERRTTYEAQRESRRSIFFGESVEAVENRLKGRLIEAQERLERQKQRQEQQRAEKAGLEATLRENEREVVRLEKRVGELSEKITRWLADHNEQRQGTLDGRALHALLSHPAEWMAEEREALLAIERAVTQAASVWEERKRQLARHEAKKPSDQSVYTLEQRRVQFQSHISESVREHGEIGFRLKQDEANKVLLGDLLVTIRAQAAVVENWSKLNEIIGSADGKKFRQMAQEYTLDVLLGYANVHLEGLSRRYRLQRVPNTLGLQVLDQDMGDEVRTVYSLSGGESFLVSLALALGLASLSTNRMQVESLFIDEGFGSLDPNTLNMAMDALERLHNQGRKVGVISHVQEMTERIAVQIQVSKRPGGRSGVEVFGTAAR